MKALVLREVGGKVAGAIEEVAESQLPAGDVTVAVQYSTLNYKDGLVLGGLGRLVRSIRTFPASISRARSRPPIRHCGGKAMPIGRASCRERVYDDV